MAAILCRAAVMVAATAEIKGFSSATFAALTFANYPGHVRARPRTVPPSPGPSHTPVGTL